MKTGLAGWWQKTDGTQQMAVGLITAAAALGPLGQGLLAALKALFDPQIPGLKQLGATLWLFVITAPVAVFVLIVVIALGRVATGAVLTAAAGASVLVVWWLSNSSLPSKLAGVYCYADFQGGRVVYAEQCRAFDSAGFIAENAGRATASGSADVFASTVAYTADARGMVMVIASLMAAFGTGLLIRRELDSG